MNAIAAGLHEVSVAMMARALAAPRLAVATAGMLLLRVLAALDGTVG